MRAIEYCSDLFACIWVALRMKRTDSGDKIKSVQLRNPTRAQAETLAQVLYYSQVVLC